MVAATRTSSAWERYAWAAGILYVIALVAVSVVDLLGGGLSQNASAAKIANTLYDHRGRLLVIACLSVVYAAMFLIYLAKLYDLLRRDTDRSRFLGSLVLAGGTLFIALHAVSDIGIFGLLGAKLASFGSQHDQGVSGHTLYLVTYGLDSVGDVFGSLFRFRGRRAGDRGAAYCRAGWGGFRSSPESCSSSRPSASAASSPRSGPCSRSASRSCCSP